MDDELRYALENANHMLLNAIEAAEQTANRAMNELNIMRKEHKLEMEEFKKKMEGILDDIRAKREPF